MSRQQARIDRERAAKELAEQIIAAAYTEARRRVREREESSGS